MLDTNTCIYAMKGSAGFSPKVPMIDCGISTVVLGELEYGVARSQRVDQNRAALNALVNAISVYPMDADAARHYGRIRAQLETDGRPIGNNDTWIAAHALSMGAPLITNNTAEFSRVPGLAIDNWMK
jgi:tRNA(fMet)-specific endonuclease VapC